MTAVCERPVYARSANFAGSDSAKTPTRAGGREAIQNFRWLWISSSRSLSAGRTSARTRWLLAMTTRLGRLGLARGHWLRRNAAARLEMEFIGHEMPGRRRILAVGHLCVGALLDP